MNVKERILTARLLEKALRHPDFAAGLGITVKEENPEGETSK